MTATLTAPKERPILFSAPMVAALLAGTKTQTRRLLKPQPPSEEATKSTPYSIGPRVARGIGLYLMDDHDRMPKEPGVFDAYGSVGVVRDACGQTEWECPYGKPGDRLWVRESFTLGEIPTTVQGAEQLKRGPIIDPDARSPWQHAAWYDGTDHPGGWFTKVKRTPSIHMPRWASRITLEITEIRVERLKKISEEDAWSEGVSQDTMPEHMRYGKGDYSGAALYAMLWQQINGAGAWDTNPFVWAVSFKRVER